MPTQGDPPSPPSPSPQKIPVADDVDPDENIPHATLELYRHTALRGANLGAVLALVFGPPVLLYRGVRKPYEMMKRLGSASLKGVVRGLRGLASLGGVDQCGCDRVGVCTVVLLFKAPL